MEKSCINDKIMQALVDRIKRGECCRKMKQNAQGAQCDDLATMFLVCVNTMNYKFLTYVLLQFTRTELNFMLDRFCRVCVGNNDADALQLLIAQADKHRLWNSSTGLETWQLTMTYALKLFISNPTTYYSKRIDVINALKTIQVPAKFRSDPAYLEEGSPLFLATLTPRSIVLAPTFVFGVGMVSPGGGCSP